MRWLKPDISQADLEQIVFIGRKGAHLAEYAILGILLWRALRKPARQVGQRWVWSESGLALLVGVLYASSDEIHQAFVPTRQGQPVDVLLDSLGVLLGLALVWLYTCFMRRKSGRL